MSRKILFAITLAALLCANGQPLGPKVAAAVGNEDNTDYTRTPPFLTAAAPPLVMIVMGRDHKLYYEAYNDASDLDGDGDLDVGYNPDEIDYYGYFDSYKCYEYDGTNKYFKPTSLSVASQYPTAGSNGKACGGTNEWSGDFLNYLTMSRMDAIRKVLYGGYRAVDGTDVSDTVLQRAYIPQEGHSWGKQYTSKAVDGYDITEYTPLSLPDAGKRHLFCSVNNTENRDPKLRLLTNQTYYIWEWVSIEKAVSGNRVVNGKTGPTVSPTDYLVRVKVCDPTVGLEGNCKLYPGNDGKFGAGNDPYKPVGLLQRYGESEQMLFGLITGSYDKNMSGGVLRKKISLITDEINANTGQYLTKDNDDFDPSDDEYKANGIIKTIDKLRIKNFSYSEYEYYPYFPDGWIDRMMQEGEFTDWGNPTAEMMYETLRYFSGAGSATSAFDYSSGDDVSLGLPKTTWDDPYAADDSWCSMPVMLVISDINPSYDSDQLPGSAFSSWPAESLGASGGTLNAQTLLDTISTTENISGTYFIGDNTSDSDYSCAPKSVTTLKNVRGLCPEEPGKEGSYYAAAVAYYGHEEDMSSKTSEQKVLTYTVGLSSPLPKIEIKLGNPEKTITLVPFGKSVWDNDYYGDYAISNVEGEYQPTNTIVDFYVEYITATSGQFRINFEDMEQAADQDMDAYVRYSYQVLDAGGNPVANPANGVKVGVTLQSVYAFGNIVQHMGYIISGTTKDGTYLEVRDYDTQNYMVTSWKKDGDKDYFLDTPPGVDPGGTWADNTPLPLIAYREFSPSGAGAAQILNDPLWYAAKWGGFRDHNLNNIPDLDAEWDEDLDGTPDNYFLVQNPLMLERQLNRAFVSILERASSGTYASLLSASRSGEGAVYQSIFFPRYKTVYWVGNVHALLVDAYGQLREDTNLNKTLDNDADKIIEFDPVNPGEVRKYTDTNGDGELTATEKSSQSPQLEDVATVKYLWSGADWLNSLDAAKILQNKAYSSSDKNRYIFTFIDGDNDMLVDSGELWPFSSSPTANLDAIKPFLHLAEPFTQSLTGSEVTSKATDQLDFIRGVDQTGMRNRKFDSDGDDVVDTTYRLGDIVSSTPTLVGAPAENYDLLYRDNSYRKFWLKYRNRRNVVYVGANDGMLHAFNAGFFYVDPNSASPTYGKWKFHTQSEGGSETAYDLGAELWAYVPFNLLPHLYWLTDPNYEHVSYVDMKPKIFDAKIFADDGPTGTHPGGWGTVLVCGMGFGGGRIRTDKDHDGVAESSDQIMKSAYFILDITNPESTPVLLAEISFDDLGFTTSYPGAIVVKSMDSETNPNNWYLVLGSGPNGARLKYTMVKKSFEANDSYPLIGELSGARAKFESIDTTNKIVTVSEVVGWFENGEKIFQDKNGNETFDKTTEASISLDILNSTSDLKNGLSSQKAKIYVIDLNSLAASTPSLKTLAPNGTWSTGASNAVSFVNTGDAAYDLDDNSLISDFITVDLDLNYSTDAMYFGTVSHGSLGLGGKLARIVLSDADTNILPTDPTSWDQYSTLFDAGQPISSAPSVAMDWKRRTWVFFGTGHFSSQADIADTSQQSYYGIKEPWLDTSGHENNRVDMNADVDGDSDLENEMTWQEVSSAYLLDVSNVVVFESGNIKNYNGVSYTDVVDLENNVLDTFYALEQEMDEDPYPANNNPAPSTDIFPNGWKLNFSAARERNLGQATLLGDVLTYTTYSPDPDVCENEGDSYLYATHYMTGTAFTSSVIGFGTATDPSDGTSMELSRKQSLGKGLASSPTLHTGSEKGSKAYVQTSGGSILVIEQENPGAVRSGKIYWMEE